MDFGQTFLCAKSELCPLIQLHIYIYGNRDQLMTLKLHKVDYRT